MANKKSNSRKQMNTVLGLVIKLLLVLMVVLICLFGYQFCYKVFDAQAMEENEDDADEVVVRIDSGMSSMDVAETMVSNGLAENKYVFYAQMKLFKSSSQSIQPGTYTLNTAMDPEEIMSVLTATSDEDEEDESE